MNRLDENLYGGRELTVVKAGTAVVSDADRTALDLESVGYIGEDVAYLNGFEDPTVGDVIKQADRWLSTILVTSGAVTAGIEKLGWDRTEIDDDIDFKRVASMVGNMALFSAWERATGFVAAPDLPTHNDLDTQESWSHLSTAITLALERGLLPIFNEGDARSTEELETMLRAGGKEFKRFGDNDQLAAHLAVQLQADRLVLLTDKDGVLEDSNDPGSVIESLNLGEINDFIIRHVDDSEKSNGGMTSKLKAAEFALIHGVGSVAIGNGKVKNGLILAGFDGHGTLIEK